MKKIKFVVAITFFLSVALLAAYGCQKDSKPNAAETVPQAKSTFGKEEREKYQKEIQDKLAEYKVKMKQFAAGAKDLKDKAKAESKEEMDELSRTISVAEVKLKSMGSATGEAWREMKTEVDSAMDRAKITYKKIAARFK